MKDTYHNGCVAWLQLELCQYPYAIGELNGLVQHVLAFHVTLGDGEDVAALQLVGDAVCFQETTKT